MRSIDIKDAHDLLIKWLKRTHINIQTHYRMASRCTGFHYWIGVPLLIATAVLGADLSDFLFSPNVAKVTTAAIGLTATLLAAVQTFFKFEKRKSSHILAAQRYGEVARRIERMLSGTCEAAPAQLDQLEDMINKAVRDSELPASRIFDEEDKKAREYYADKQQTETQAGDT